jgi:hypothetical protein
LTGWPLLPGPIWLAAKAAVALRATAVAATAPMPAARSAILLFMASLFRSVWASAHRRARQRSCEF